MAVDINVGQKIKVYIDDKPFYGEIIRKDNDTYTVSVLGKGNSYNFTEDEIIVL